MRRYVPLVFAGLALFASCSVPGHVTREAAPTARSSKATAARGNVRALYEAAERGDLAGVRRLVEPDPALLTSEDRFGWNVLHYAAWAGRKEVYDYLVARGCPTSLFTEAALGPLPAFAARLKARPAAVRDRDPRERATPLAWAARSGNREACLYLLSLGAEVDAADRSGDTPLHAAAGRGDAELCRALLRAGGAPDAVGVADGEGNTPLHAAAAGGHLEICEYLLLRGALRATKTRRGLTAAALAARNGHARLAELLKEWT
jgi:ankyrin repeat protein